jgi:hypothetical protein
MLSEEERLTLFKLRVELRKRLESYFTGLLLKKRCSELMSLDGREGVHFYSTGICELRGKSCRSYFGLKVVVFVGRGLFIRHFSRIFWRN